MSKLLGWLTLAGLLLIVLAIGMHGAEAAYPAPLILLCLGAFCFFGAGIPWAHTPGRRGFKIAFLGLSGFAVGAPVGLFLGDCIAPKTGAASLGFEITAVIVGFGIGGILLGAAGIWWGRKFHRDLDRRSKAAGNGS